MIRLFKKKEMISFSGRKHTKLGVISALIGISTVMGFIITCIISGLKKSEGGFIFGVIGLLLLALSAFGFVLSYKAMKQKDIFYRFPIIGALLNGIITIFLFIIYIVGFGS